MLAGPAHPRHVRALAVIDGMVQAAARPGFAGIVGPVAIGAGAGLGLFSFLNDDFAASVLKPRATAEMRTAAITFLGAGIVLAVPLLVALGVALQRRGRVDSLAGGLRLSVARFAWVAALPLVGAVRSDIEARRPDLLVGFVLTVATLVGISAYHLMRPASAESLADAKRRTHALPIATLAIGAAALFIWRAIGRHLVLESGPRLGEVTNVCSNMLRGQWFHCTVCPGKLPTHFEPVTFLLSGLMALRPGAETLIVLQSVALTAAAVPLYFMVSRRASHALGLVTALAYLAHPLTHGTNTGAFYPIALSVPLIFGSLLAFEARRFVWYGVLTLLAWSTGEQVAVVTALIGLYASLSTEDLRGRRLGGAAAVLSVAYLVAVRWLVPLDDPALGSASFGRLSRAIGASTEVGDLFAVVFDERRLSLLFRTLAPALFLPLLGRGFWPVLVVGVLTLAPHDVSRWSEDHVLLLPLLMVFTGDALRRLDTGILSNIEGPRLARAVGASLVAAALLLGWKLGGVAPNRYFDREPVRSVAASDLAAARWLSTLPDKLPPKTTVTASPRLVPHLATMAALVGPRDRKRAGLFVAHRDDGESMQFLKSHAWVPVKSKALRHGKLVVYRKPTAKEAKAARARAAKGKKKRARSRAQARKRRAARKARRAARQRAARKARKAARQRATH